MKRILIDSHDTFDLGDLGFGSPPDDRQSPDGTGAPARTLAP